MAHSSQNPPHISVVRANLRQLEADLQGELTELMASVAAQEDASRVLEDRLMELSDALSAAQKGKKRD